MSLTMPLPTHPVPPQRFRILATSGPDFDAINRDALCFNSVTEDIRPVCGRKGLDDAQLSRRQDSDPQISTVKLKPHLFK